MRIVSITPDIDSGGAAKSLFLLARQMVADGHTMHILSIARPSRTRAKVQALEALGVTVDYFDIPYFPIRMHVCPVPFWRNVRRAFEHRAEYRRLAARVREIGPDVVHYNSYTTLFISLWLKEFPAVLHAREVLIEPSRFLSVVKPLVRARINGIVGITPEEGDQAARLFSVPTTTVFNWPAIAPRLAPPPESGPLVYAVFSHVTPIKGHLDCVRAVALAADRLRRAGVKVRLFGGRVPIHEAYYQSVLREIETSNLGDIVEFPGFVDNPEEEMARTDLIVRPDVTGQPWGRDVIEAMSLGRPVLAVGERDYFVKNGRTGMLTPPGDVPALAEGMVRLADRETLRRLGRGAYEFAREHFDPVGNPRRIIQWMEAMAAGASASGSPERGRSRQFGR